MGGNDGILQTRRGRQRPLLASQSILGDGASTRTRGLFLLTVLLLVIQWARFPASRKRENGAGPKAGALQPLKPRGAIIANATEVWWMLPAASLQVRGVLLAFHGCNRGGGYDFFRMPQDRIVAHEALQRGLAVVALSSQNRKSGCWSLQDAQTLEQHSILQRWFERVGLHDPLPLLAMGASSGGAFLFSLYQTVPVVAMAAYITKRFFEKEDFAKGAIPPTALVHMPRDRKTAPYVSKNFQALNDAGISTQLWEIHPHPFTPELCGLRLPELGEKACQDLLHHWTETYPQLVDPKDYSILSHPSGNEWEEAFASAEKMLPDVETPPLADDDDDNGHFLPYPTTFFKEKTWIHAMLKEEVAAAFARHEMVAEKGTEVLDWLMRVSGISTDASIS